MSVSLSITSYNSSTGVVSLKATIVGATDEGDNFYIDYKNTDASFYLLYGEGQLDFGATDETVVNLDLQCGRLFTGTSKTFRFRCNGQSGTASVILPMSYTPSSYTIPERPIQQTQYVTYDGIIKGEAGCCVANTTASCIEVLKMRSGNTVYPYSVGWIFGGAGDGTSDYLNYEPTFNFLKTNGTPPAQVLNSSVATGYPDIYYQSDAKTLYNNNYSSALSYATPQRIGSWTKLTTSFNWNYESIFNAIQRENTTVLLTMNINKSFDDAKNNGWVGVIKESQRGGHSMIVLGWIVSSGKYYWICQNSWCYQDGTPFGDNGLYYIPFDHFTYDGLGMFDFYAITRDENAPTIPTIPDNTGLPNLVSRTKDGFNLTCNFVNLATSYEFRYRRSDSSVYNSSVSSSNNISISGLDYGYTYYLSVRFYKNGIWSSYSKESQCTVLPDFPTIEKIYSTTQNNIIAKLKSDSMSGKFSYIEVCRRNTPWVNTDNNLDKKVLYSLNTLAEWTELPTGQKYAFATLGKLEVNGTILTSYYRSEAVDGVVGSVRPSYFSWDTEKVKGNQINVTASEWNRLTANINEMLEFKKKDKITFTEARPNMVISKSIFNEARNAIYASNVGLNSSIGIPSTISIWGTPVVITANHFNKLVESLNSVT